MKLSYVGRTVLLQTYDEFVSEIVWKNLYQQKPNTFGFGSIKLSRELKIWIRV